MNAYVPLNERRHRAHAKLLAAVGRENLVLDVGCSIGYLAAPLVARRNTVVGVELDAAAARVAQGFCEQVLLGDIETMELPLEPGSFDVVLLGDVIEHLRDPAVLRSPAREEPWSPDHHKRLSEYVPRLRARTRSVRGVYHGRPRALLLR